MRRAYWDKNIRETLINFTFTCSLTLFLIWLLPCIEKICVTCIPYLEDYSSSNFCLPFFCLLFIQQSVDSCAKYCLWIDDEMQHQTNSSLAYMRTNCVIFFAIFLLLFLPSERLRQIMETFPFLYALLTWFSFYLFFVSTHRSHNLHQMLYKKMTSEVVTKSHLEKINVTPFIDYEL